MLCLTGNEKCNTELLERLTRPVECPQPLVYEIRSDLLGEPPDFAGILSSGRKIIFTCRRTEEGGSFAGCENERMQLFEKALDFTPWAIDVEFDTAPDFRDTLIKKAQACGVKVILSKHFPRRCPDVCTEVNRLRSVEADYWKFVAPVDDSAELCEWLDIENDGKLILIASGAAGQISRFWYRRFASPFTYIAMDKSSTTADFQPVLADVLNGRISFNDDDEAFLIMGGSQIVNSRGPDVFNRLFVEKNFKGAYSLAIAEEPQGLLKLAEKLGVAGASVTKPLKEKIIPLLDSIDERTLKISAVNTLCRDADGWRGTNTDVVGFEGSLKKLYGGTPPHGQHALLLGAGGAARAVAYALLSSGFKVCVCNRTHVRAEKLASEFGLDVCNWEDRGGIEFDLLVNSTSIGMDDPDSTPFPFIERLKGRRILDIISHPAETRLVLEARRAGTIAAMGGKVMWQYQALGQLDFWLGWKIALEELEELT